MLSSGLELNYRVKIRIDNEWNYLRFFFIYIFYIAVDYS